MFGLGIIVGFGIAWYAAHHKKIKRPNWSFYFPTDRRSDSVIK